MKIILPFNYVMMTAVIFQNALVIPFTHNPRRTDRQKSNFGS